MKIKKIFNSYLVFALAILISFVSGISLLLLSKNFFNQNKVIIDTNAVTGPLNTDSTWIDENNYADSFARGNGEINNPYIISNEQELARLSYLVYNGNNFANTYFKQSANLDMSDFYWQPIGVYYDESGNTVQRYFSGNYDGGEFTISGLFTKPIPQDATTQQLNARSYQGLFGYLNTNLDSLVIKNITIKDSFIQGYKYVGGVVGYSNIYNYNSNTNYQISNCFNYAQISTTDDYVGGIAGIFTINGSTLAKIEDCSNYGQITAIGNYVGGIAGDASSITNCYNFGEINVGIVTDYNDIFLGGIAGDGSTYNGYIKINQCKNNGTLNIIEFNNAANKLIYIGGIAGRAVVDNCLNTKSLNVNENISELNNVYYGGIVGYGGASNCYNNLNISLNCNVGGIIGYAKNTISNCYNYGTINGDGYVGGIAAYSGNEDNINKCYNSGDISGSGYLGGIIGYFNVSTFSSIYLKNSFNSGSIINSNQDENSATGGLIGIILSNSREQNLQVINCYNKGEISSTNNVGGLIGKVDMSGTGVIDTSGELIACFNVGNVIGSNNVGAIIGNALINDNVDYLIKSCYYGDANNSTLNAIGNNYNADATYLSNIYTLAKTQEWFNDSSYWGKLYTWDFISTWGFEVEENDGLPLLTTSQVQYWSDSGIRALTFAGGNGSIENPFLISNGSQLGYLAAVVNGLIEDSRAEKYTNELGFNCYFDGKYFKQTQDIDLSAYFWNPIGNGDINTGLVNAFAGNYDGGDFSISGIKMGDTDLQGLFGFISNTSDSNTIIENITIENSNFKSSGNVGSIAGMCFAFNLTIKNCHNSATILSSSNQSESAVGGILGYGIILKNGLVENCSNSGEVYCEVGAGGIAGIFGAMLDMYSDASACIKNCFNEGSISNAGIVYNLANGNVDSCYNIGEINGNEFVSGIVASEYNATIEGCYNSGEIIGNEFVAGILGDNYSSTVNNCYNTGNITGKGQYVGGIAAGSDVNKSYNSGIIIGGSYVGGIAGSGSATNCYNVGTVTATGDYVGGIIGYGGATVCYNTATIVGNNYVGGLVGNVNANTGTNFNTGLVTKTGSDSNNYLGAIAGYSNSVSYIKNCFYGGDCPNSIPDIGGGNIGNSVYQSNLKELVKYNSTWINETLNSIENFPYTWDFLGVWGYEEGVNDNYPIFVEADFWTNEDNRATSFAGGTGTEKDPYLIETPSQLAYLSYLVMSGEGENHIVDSNGYNSYYSGYYFKQIADIDLSGHIWQPIGLVNYDSNVYQFSGNYDGNNFTISGIETTRVISIANYPQGLFGWIYVEDGDSVEIKNIKITNSYFNGIVATGGIVAIFEGSDNYSTISNCIVEGEIYCISQENSAETGGIVGRASGNLNITNCVNNANVESNGKSGGIIGSDSASLSMNLVLNQTQIINCINNGNVIGTNKVGGIVGSTGANISECYNTGLISGNQDVGGIAGYFTGGGKQQYYNKESFKSTLQDCYNSGEVNGQSNVGGIVGYFGSVESALANTYNKESVSGQDFVGGVAGKISSTGAVNTDIYRNFNIAYVIGTTNVGAVFGGVETGNIQSGVNEYGGACPSTMAGVGSGTLFTTYIENLEQKAKDISYYYTESITDEYYWDFGGVWGFDSSLNDGYPIFVDVEFWTDPGLRGDSLKGTGTANDPYLISSAKDLAYIAYSINNGLQIKTENSTTSKTPDASTYFKQTANIDISQYYWEPIGWSYNLTKQFSSNYDGCGFMINGLKTVDRAQASLAIQGLFGLIVTLSDAITIQNLNILASKISGYSVGALAGYAMGNEINIINCHSYAIVDNYCFSGGLIGNFSVNNGNIENCSSYGEITEKEEMEVDSIVSGGLIGATGGNTNFINCSSSVKITGQSNIGGFVGMILASGNQTLSFNNCFSTATLTATGENVGGFIGEINKDKDNYICQVNIVDSGFEGYINSESATTGAFIGDIGDVATTISNCYSVVDISGNSTLTDLDFVGNLGEGVLSNCVYVIDKNGILNKKYIGTDFSGFVWGNTTICPLPKNLYWYGEFLDHDVTFDITGGLSNWVAVSK